MAFFWSKYFTIFINYFFLFFFDDRCLSQVSGIASKRSQVNGIKKKLFVILRMCLTYNSKQYLTRSSYGYYESS